MPCKTPNQQPRKTIIREDDFLQQGLDLFNQTSTRSSNSTLTSNPDNLRQLDVISIIDEVLTILDTDM